MVAKTEIEQFLKAKKQQVEWWAATLAAIVVLLGVVTLMSEPSSNRGLCLLNLGMGIVIGSLLTNGGLRGISRRQLIQMLESRISRDPDALRELSGIRGNAVPDVQSDRG